MFCSNCGFENEERANFCFKCGKPMRKISPVSGQPVQQPQNSQTEATTPQQSMHDQPLYQSFGQPPLQQNLPTQQFPPQQGSFLNQPEFKTQKNKKNFLPLIIAIAFITVVGTIAGILFMLQKKTPIFDYTVATVNDSNEEDSQEASTDVENDINWKTTEDSPVSPSPIPSQAPDTIEAADLELWYISYGEGDPIINDSISRFMSDYPQCNVNVSIMDSTEYYSKLELALASGEMPDIFATWADGTFYNYAMNGQLQDITDYMQQDNYQDRFMDAGISQVTYQNKIYGVPAGTTALYGIYYNRDIFNQYGLQEPTTIAELEQICNTLSENGITPFEFGNYPNFFGSIYFTCLAARKSGIKPLLASYEGNNTLLEDGFLYASEKIQEWIGNGYFNEGFNDLDDSGAITEFCNGNGAMYLSGSWSTYTLQTQMPDYPYNLGFFAFPAYSENDRNSSIAIGTVGDTFYSVSSLCDNPEAAFKAITYLIDDSAIDQRANNILLPLKNSVPDDVIEQKIIEILNNADAVFPIYYACLPSSAADTYNNNLYGLFDLSIGAQEFYDMIKFNFP